LDKARRKLSIVAATLTASAALVLGGETGPDRPFLAPQALLAQEQRPQQEYPVFGATLDRVRVDVIVTDAEGRFVADLRPEEFVVYEDGVRQEVRSVQLVDLVAGRVTELAPGPASGGGGDESGGGGGDGSGAGDAESGSIGEAIQSSDFGAIVYLIDFPSLDHRIKLNFVEAWERLLARTESFNVPQAVYLVDNVGRLREIAALTMDVEAVREAVGEVGETGLTLAPGSAGRTRPGEPELAWMARTKYTFELLRQFADALAARPGRTALVWVSAGVTLRGLSVRSRRMPGYFPNQGVLDLQRDMHRAANTSNVSIYPVDPSRWVDFLGPEFFSLQPLPSGDVGSQSSGDLGDRSAPGRAGSRAGSERDEFSNSLHAAAEETGGRAFILQAYLDEVLQTIEEESSRYYLLTYAAPPPSGDGEYHEIRVEVSRPDVEVRNRSGYVDSSSEERRSRFVSAALSQPGTVVDLPITVDSKVVGWDESRAVVETTLHIDVRELGVRVAAAGQREVALEVHAALLDDDLDLVDELHDEEAWIRGAAGAEADERSPELVTYRHRWRLRPGEYDLRIMVQDTVSGRVGAVSVPFEVPSAPRR
jgi:VWFA-related protein